MNRVKKILTSFIIFAGVLGVASALGFNNGILTNPFEARAADDLTNLSLSNSVTDSTSFTSIDYHYEGLGSKDHPVMINFSHVKKGDSGVGVIQSYSKIERSGTYSDSRDLKTVKVNFDVLGIDNDEEGNYLFIQTWYNSNDTAKRNYVLRNNQQINIEGNYFRIKAGSNDVSITSIDFNFNCYQSVAAPTYATSIKSMDSCVLEEDLTNKEHYWVLKGKLNNEGDLLNNVEIFDGSRYLSVEEILCSKDEYEIRCNIFASASSLGTDTFYPHMKINGNLCKIHGDSGDVKVTTYSNDSVSSNGEYKNHAVVNTYNKNTYSAQSFWNMPLLKIDPIKPYLYHSSASTGVSLPFTTSALWANSRTNGNEVHYCVRMIQANKYFKFVGGNANSSSTDTDILEIYDWNGTDLHVPDRRLSAVEKSVIVNGEKYELIRFEFSIYNIIKQKYTQNSGTYRGNNDTLLFQYSCKKVKNGTTLVEQVVANDVNLALDNANKSDWTHIQSIPTGPSNVFYTNENGYKQYSGRMYAHVISEGGRAGIGLYVDDVELQWLRDNNHV